MDTEDKLNAVNHDASFDPDAAELLKDLEDEEDDAVQDAAAPNSPSLMRLLSSACELETIATVPSLPIVPQKNQENDTTERFQQSVAEVSLLNDTTPEQTPTQLPPIDIQLEDSTPPAPKTPVKKPQSPSQQKISAKTPPKTIPKDEDLPKTSLPNAAKGSPPPVPPPPPVSNSNPRVLRDNETAYTQETLADIMAGGKDDEARDLAAHKFTDNGWYTQVFNDDFLRTIPKSTTRQTKREAKFIIDRLGIETGARVLDLACGYGRHTIELAKQGFDMVGLDLSMVMLKKALADAQTAGQVIKFVHGDMQKLSFKAIFDAIYSVQTSFGYFDDQKNFKVLQGIYRALKPGGVFLLETVNRDFIVEDLPLRLWWKGHECMLLEEIDIEHISGFLKVKRSFVFDDQARAPWEQNINIRLYTPIELRAMLMRAGFSVVELSGDYSLPGAFFGATSPKIIFVAEKHIK